jgi:hypothetical protein
MTCGQWISKNTLEIIEKARASFCPGRERNTTIMIEFSLSSISVARMLAPGERGPLNVPFNRYEGYGRTTP